jgi:TRAP-type C4-dicarboxylate transport system substrate-binding protein
MNKKAWDGLPDFVKKIVMDATGKWSEWQANVDDTRRADYIKSMKSQGVTFSELPQEERVKWAHMMPNIAKEWAESVDKRGLPGTLVLKTFMDELRARNIAMARQWDKE